MDRSQGESLFAIPSIMTDSIREAELLHHYITSAAQNPPPAASHFVNQNFQLGGDANNTSAVGSNDVAPDQSVSTASSGKVAGSAM